MAEPVETAPAETASTDPLTPVSEATPLEPAIETAPEDPPAPENPPPPPPPTEADILKQAILGAVSGKITPMNVGVCVTAAMKLLRKQSKLTGPEKKLLLVEVLEGILRDQDWTDEEIQQSMYILSGTIDQLAHVSKHGLGGKGGCCNLM